MTYLEMLEKLLAELALPPVQAWATLDQLRAAAANLDDPKRPVD